MISVSLWFHKPLMAQRELTGDEIEQLLREQRIVRVAFFANGMLYLLPLGYIWIDGALHLMTSAGQKTAMAAESPRVAFQIDNAPEKGMLAWSSVTGEGKWEVIRDSEVQRRIAGELIGRFPELREWAVRESAGKQAAAALVFARIKPLWMTGRAFSD